MASFMTVIPLQPDSIKRHQEENRMQYDDLVAAIAHLNAAWEHIREGDQPHHEYMADHLVTMCNKLNEERLKILGGYMSLEALKKEADRGPVVQAT